MVNASIEDRGELGPPVYRSEEVFEETGRHSLNESLERKGSAFVKDRERYSG